MTRLTIHHLANSQSERIVWLVEELGVPSAFKRYERDGAGQAPPEYKALHSCGTAPIITDGEVALGETGAIFEYLLAKYDDGKLAVPPTSPEYPNYLFWLHYAIGSMHPRTVTQLMLSVAGAGDGRVTQSLTSRLDHGYRMIENRLGENEFLGGATFSAADIMTVFVLTHLRRVVTRDLTPYPNIRGYLERIVERPAYQRAMKKAEPDTVPLLG